MSLVLYDLCGADPDRRFSPFCWRVKMALAHKGIDFETKPVPFLEIEKIGGGDVSKTVPVIEHNGQFIRESFDIALYLEQSFPDAPTLFGGDGGVALSRFVEMYAGTMVAGHVARAVVKDIHDILGAEDQAYFRTSREKRFSNTLEDVQAGREAAIADLAKALTPVRMMLGKQPYLGGEGPLFADYILFGFLQWPRVASAAKLLTDDDPVLDWFNRCLDLHNGIGRAMSAAA